MNTNKYCKKKMFMLFNLYLLKVFISLRKMFFSMDRGRTYVIQ